MSRLARKECNKKYTPTALPWKAHMTFSEWRKAIQRQVWLDLFRSGVMIIRNSCIEYFHAKAQKLQKVWRSKAQENAIEGVVELDVWGCQSYTLCREFQRTSCESRLSRAFFDEQVHVRGGKYIFKSILSPAKERRSSSWTSQWAFVLNRERFNTNSYRNGRAFVLNRERFNTDPLALFVLNRSRFNTKYKMHANFKLNRSMAGLLY